MKADRPRILLVEDDPTIGHSVHTALTATGHQVHWHTNLRDAATEMETARPDLVLLDLALPDGDGLSLCRRIRQRHRDLPIIGVTARDAEIDIVVGLDAGASDYVTKPFSVNVLLARVRAHLRAIVEDDRPITIGRLLIDRAAHQASIDGTALDLRPKEFDALTYLAVRVGRAVTRESMLADVWDVHWSTNTKTVDMHIVTLRRKLGDAATITTVRGVGYRLELP